MMEYTKQSIKDIIIDKCDVSQTEIDGTVDMILKLTPKGKDLFEKWYQTGTIDKFDIEGITPDFLVRRYGFKELALISMYDWLVRDPKEASKMLKNRMQKQ